MAGFLKNRAGSVLASNDAQKLKDNLGPVGPRGLAPELYENINMGNDGYTTQVGAVLGTGYDTVSADYQPGEQANRPSRMLDSSTREPNSQKFIRRSK